MVRRICYILGLSLCVSLVYFQVFDPSSPMFQPIEETKAVQMPPVSMDSAGKLPFQLANANGDADELVDIIWKRFVYPPSDLAYNLKGTGDKFEQDLRGQHKQAEKVDTLLNHKRNGFFVEAGAFDGEYLSNSLFFEMKRNWTGILVEGNDLAFGNLLSKHRKAFALHSCLSLTNSVQEVTFEGADVFGGIKDAEAPYNLIEGRRGMRSDLKVNSRIHCFPLHSILKAFGNPTVDYLSLDVEGSELPILKTIPWDKVDIRVVTIEVAHSDGEAIRKLMTSAGYQFMENIENIDMVFMKKL